MNGKDANTINIPTHWTGAEALRVSGLLQALVNAIWSTHGGEMRRQIEVDAAYDEYLALADFDEAHEDDEIPW